MRNGMKFFKAILAASLAASAHAAPYVPLDGNQVIERLPKQSAPARSELERLRAEQAAAPGNLEVATTLARRYIEAGRKAGDPRYLGYAQAALSTWWEQPDPPPEVRVLRATVLQSQHQFEQAISDLDAVLRIDPGNAQAWLTKATVLQVQGEYDMAKRSCLRLRGLAPELVTATCIASMESLSGQATRGYALLDAALKRNEDADNGIKAWATTLQAEIANRQGKRKSAETHFRQALALDPSDIYLRGEFADFLLDDGRFKEAAALLEGRTDVDALLLRRAIALYRLGSSTAAESVDLLRSRFDAAELRGDTLHGRERARFELHLRDDPEAALGLALKNWEQQKEPADARILLEAAIASDSSAHAEPVVNWVKRTGLEDRKLNELIAQLETAE
jgi:tetratricopeptide (TPR) repeat protein